MPAHAAASKHPPQRRICTRSVDCCDASGAVVCTRGARADGRGGGGAAGQLVPERDALGRRRSKARAPREAIEEKSATLSAKNANVALGTGQHPPNGHADGKGQRTRRASAPPAPAPCAPAAPMGPQIASLAVSKCEGAPVPRFDGFGALRATRRRAWQIARPRASVTAHFGADAGPGGRGGGSVLTPHDRLPPSAAAGGGTRPRTRGETGGKGGRSSRVVPRSPIASPSLRQSSLSRTRARPSQAGSSTRG